MGRPPCCDKVGVKKGPWTPEEDIMLVSYVQEHGPGNWSAVPTTTGLRRCSKSCRLRWTNYLRPGIKRGTFTDHEENIIIQLQTLLGNKWAAIASYLPERTDNDIKNYWNTHLKKKLKKLENGTKEKEKYSCNYSRGQRLQTDIKTAKQGLEEITISSSSSSSYAWSTDNIARLLKQWVKTTPKSRQHSSSNNSTATTQSEASESLFGFESNFESSNSDKFSTSGSPTHVRGSDPNELAPLSVVEKWLLDYEGKDFSENFLFDENPNLF